MSFMIALYQIPSPSVGLSDGLTNTRPRKTSSKNDEKVIEHVKRSSVVNTNFDHSNAVGASPVGAAPTTSSFSP